MRSKSSNRCEAPKINRVASNSDVNTRSTFNQFLTRLTSHFVYSYMRRMKELSKRRLAAAEQEE